MTAMGTVAKLAPLDYSDSYKVLAEPSAAELFGFSDLVLNIVNQLVLK